MIYLPVLWLVVCLLLTPSRPGFMLGCAILAFQYDNLYDTSAIGPSLYVLFTCTIVLISFINKRSIVLNSYDYLIILFGVLYVFSALYSPDIIAGLQKTGGFLLLCVGYYFIGRFLSYTPVYRERFIIDFGISILILTLLFGYLSVGQQETSARLMLGEGSAVGFSQMIDIAAGFSLFYLLSVSGNKVWFKRTAMLIPFAGVITLLLFNATRGSVVSLVFAFCVYMAASILQWKPGNRHFTRILSLGFMTFGVFVILLPFSDQSGVLAGFERLGMNFGPSGFQGDTSSTARLMLFRQAWDMFAEAPLFGQGVGSFMWKAKPYYPHNVFFELLAETGLITTTVFTILLVRTGWLAVRMFSYPLPEAIIVAGMFFVLVAHQQISFALWMAKPMFLTMGIIVSLYVRSNAPQSSASSPRQSANVAGRLIPEEYAKNINRPI